MADEDEFSEPRTVKRGEVVRFHSVELCGPAFVLVLMLLLFIVVLAFIVDAAPRPRSWTKEEDDDEGIVDT